MHGLTDIEISAESPRASVFLLQPVSPRGQEWCDDHLPDDTLRWGLAYAIEHNYIGPIAKGAKADGLAVEISV